jgi:NADH dehydrogenase/NADH:ubiquinone oxidoreductase subunit G
MAKNVKLVIDGIEVKAPVGANLIEAAEMAGIHIPNLCYLKGMKGIGACRLCLVDVEGAKAPVIACNTKVKDGMNVTTNTESIIESRKFVIDMILSMHPLDCMTCTKAGVCRLQQYAYDLEVKESSFKRKKFGYPTDEKNPFIKRDPEYCILCGRCVRVCSEQGTNVLDFMGRGIGSKVSTLKDNALQDSGCTFCGSCVDACPVNALLESDRWRKGREWEYEMSGSVCLLCGNACDIQVCSKDGSVQKINSMEDIDSGMNYICAYGRFGFDSLESDTRITSPMAMKNGKLEEISWDEALKAAAGRLKKAKDKTGILSTAGIWNEDALAIRQFATDAVGTKNYDTTMSLYADAETLVNSQKANSGDADLIVLVGLDPSQQERVLPELSATITKKTQRGAKLIVINSSETELDATADVCLRGDEVKSLKSFVKAAVEKGVKDKAGLSDAVKDAATSDDALQAAELFAKSSTSLVFASPSLFGAASNVSLLKGNAVAVPYESNAKGVALMGLTTEGKTYKEMSSGGMTVLYAIGEMPLNKRPDTDFLIVQGSYMTALAKKADLLLPAATYLESSGSVVDYKGTLKSASALIEPAGESMTHRNIIASLSKAMGKSIKQPTDAQVRKSCKVKAEKAFRPFERKKELDTSPGKLFESLNGSVLKSTRITWLREAQKVTAG